MANAIVVTDEMSGIDVGKNMASLRYTEDIQNGRILGIGDYEDGQFLIRKGIIPVDGVRLALVASDEINRASNAATDFLGEFINKAGEPLKCYVLVRGDKFSETKVGFEGGADAEVGDVAYLPTGETKIHLGDTPSGIEFGKVIGVRGDLVTVEVTANV